MLPSDLRGSYERFYGTDFSRLRLWTGSALPRLLGADAITWNEQIWLADAAPDFSSPRTVGMLAHELAHVCQQRNAGRPARPLWVGRADDRLEAEAHACAAAFFSGSQCPTLTADTSPALRRVLSIVPGSAKLTFDFGSQKPTSDIGIDGAGTRLFVGHLPKGFTDINTISDALFWKGEAQVRSAVSDPAELRTLRFGFIQFCRFDAMNFTYIGRTPSDGEVDINPFGALAATLALDSSAAPGTNPFMSDIDLAVSRGVAPATAGDHPAIRAPVQVVNRATSALNFLFEVIDRRRFFTVLSAQERGTAKFQHLANHSWDLAYRFKLVWRGGNPVVSLNSSDLTPLGPVAPGPPTDSALAALLASPSPPFANDLARAALTSAAAGGLPTREDLNTRRAVSVPADFFL
jgi:hypothetical protein